MKLFKSLPFYKRSNYSTACNNLSLTTHLQKRSFFLKDDVANVEKVAKYRNIKVLDKFLSIEPDIYRKICLYFVLNYSSNPLIIGSYLSNLFDIWTYLLEKLNELFKGDLDFVSILYNLLKEDLYIWTFGNIFKELLVNREDNSSAASQRQ